MNKKTCLRKKIKFFLNRWAKKWGLLKTLRSISREKYAEKISASLFYGLMSAIAVNFFFQPGKVYSSGVTGLAQVISALAARNFGLNIPVSLAFYTINLPLLILAWHRIGHRFTVFTFITVTLSSLFIQAVPQVTLTTDPIINAIFGGLIMGVGIGYGLMNNISSGGTDIVSLTIRRMTGREVGNISLLVNGIIMVMAALLFGWKYALYSMIAIFVSSRMTNALYTKQRKMQAMIVTSHPDKVIQMIHRRLKRGVTLINEVEGTYTKEKKAILMTIITRAEFSDFKYIIKKTDPTAFVSVAENIQIIGRFAEEDMD